MGGPASFAIVIAVLAVVVVALLWARDRRRLIRARTGADDREAGRSRPSEITDAPVAAAFVGAVLEEGLASSPLTVVIHDDAMVIRYANAAALVPRDGGPSDLVGASAEVVLSPVICDMHGYLLRTGATDLISFTTTAAAAGATSEERVLRMWSVPIRTAEGACVLILGCDITGEVHAERERLRRLEITRRAGVQADAQARDALTRVDDLREKTQVLRDEIAVLRVGLELQSDWILAVERDGTVLMANDAVRMRTGTETADVRGRRLHDLFTSETADAFLGVASDVLEDGHPVVFVQRAVHDDRVSEVVWTIGPYQVGGRVAGVVGIARPHVSGDDGQLALARKHVTQIQTNRVLGHVELHTRRQQEVDASKDEVLALISHDLRTPLTSILGYTDLLLGGRSGLDARNERFVRVIARNVERLMELVDDLLLIAQHQSGALTVSPSPICVEAAVAQSVAAQHPVARAKDIVFSIDIADGLMVMADPVRLGQVLDNVVTNAVNYTPGGGYITVSAEPDGDWVRFRVSDSGPGIPDEEQERIFHRFTRARDAAAGGVKGFGLGLPISHAIVSAHGGEMGVDSTLGIGSTFWFTLPQGGRMGEDDG